MRTVTFAEGVMRSLTTDQKNEIRHSNKGYVNFIISISNTDAVIRTELSDLPREIPGDEWNGYDFALRVTDVNLLLDRYGL